MAAAEVSAPMPGADGIQRLPLALPITLDVTALQASLASIGNIEGSVSSQRINAPDAGLIVAIYTFLATKLSSLQGAAEALEATRVEASRREIEVETALNDAERARTEAEQRAEVATTDALSAKAEQEKLRSELQGARLELDAARSTSESGGEAQTQLQQRIATAQQEKRDLLALLDREKADSASRSEEVQLLSERQTELRGEVTRLSSELAEAKSSENNLRYKVQSLEQELALVRRDSEWAHAELKTITESAASYRSNKSAELIALQSAFDTAQQNLSSANTKLVNAEAAYSAATLRLNENASRIQELTTRLAAQEESFAAEIATQSKLHDLLTKRAKDAQKREHELDTHWQDAVKEFAEREDKLREEIELERNANAGLQKEKEDLKLALDRLAEGVGIVDSSGGALGGAENGELDSFDQNSRASTPGAKRFSGVGLNTSLLMSPTAALASKLQRGGKSFTQVYADFTRTQEELRRERLETQRLGQVLETVFEELRVRQPVLQAQREETEHLREDLQEMSERVANLCEERDVSENERKHLSLEAQRLRMENDLGNRQLADLGRQVRSLTREIIIRDDPSAASRLEDDGSAIPEPIASDAEVNETQAVITTQLVTFSSLTDLLAQNQRLLRVTRELAGRVEQEEQKLRAALENNENEAVSEAAEVIENLNEEIKAERSKSEALKRERDMFRAMINSRTANGANSAAVNGGQTDATSSSVMAQSLANQYSTLQAHFEAYKAEVRQDTEMLKEDVADARQQASQAAVQAAREKASREATDERYRTLQQTFDLQKSELAELNKIMGTLRENLARRDMAAHKTEEELLNVKASLERLRIEAANLRAEKDLLKSTESRLLEESHAVVAERTNLSELLRNISNTHNDMERSASEHRRRMEAQIAHLEEESRSARDKAGKKEEEARMVTLRKEVETRDLQSRLDKATAEASSAKEQLAAVNTSLSHLRAKAADLQKQLTAREEKLDVFERHSAAASTGASSRNVAGSSGNREQELEITLAELRSELRNANVEVEQAKAHVEQYKAIAQANEDSLAQLQSTYDQFKAETDAGVAQKDAEITVLRTRIEAISNELTAAQDEGSIARQNLEAQRTEFAAEKRTLEDAIAQLSNLEERVGSEQQVLRSDVQRQAELARAAHAKYEAELMLHAEDVKALTQVKATLASAEAQVRELQKDVETVQINLTASQVSWEEQKSTLEKERLDLNKRIEDLTSQNNVLHNSLESLTSQASAIQSRAETSTDGDTSFSSSPMEELREVIKYLRREKEIAELQMNLNKQEAARLRQSLDHANQTLGELHMQLSEERSKNASTVESSAQHAELLDKVNQLSILRESNATLREETERANRRARELETALSTTTAQIEPLNERLRTTQVELESLQAQLKLVQEDNKRWQARAQSILQQYNQVDPEEIKRLEQRATAAEAVAEEEKKKVVELEAAKAQGEERFTKLRTQTIERLKERNDQAAKYQAEIERLKEQVSNASKDSEALKEREASLSTVQADVKRLQEENTKLQEKSNKLQQEISTLQAAAASIAQQQMEGGASANAVADAVAEAEKKWEEEKRALSEAATSAKTMEQQHLSKARTAVQEKNTAMVERDAAQAALKAAQAEQATANATAIEEAVTKRLTQLGGTEGGDPATAATVASLQTRIAELEEEVKKAKEVAELEQPKIKAANAAKIEQLKKEHDEKLRAREANLATKFSVQQAQAVEEAVQKATAAAAESASAPSIEKVEAEVQARLQKVEQQREEERQAALKAAVEAKAAELAKEHEEALKARFEAGKEEAGLRHKLVLSKKDKQIATLQAQLAEGKGSALTGDGAGSVPASPTTGAAPAVVKPATRGGAVGRGRGRGGAVSAAAGVGKRKAEDTPAAGSPGDTGAAKKPRGGGSIAVQRPTLKRPGAAKDLTQ
ncbi:hypothetical protein K437DRAFT_254932 [Tilletiaria anomala UBC 951]|uniref:Uncharacterized protein n=1 Tax=Tilletiaria anomala (strain ATCC 24038 / CBS 436.72 / UBC 951) TaxID=1037660 RepID=A0A066WBQ7_TILAU|nr:uncharacterized protein K437DRAFT_254932 [Tilletiaria anomala UBC 951]KDN51342.1 hypothetical protein K437DRAFT_254932 [Tilletiaria anomala UBC 951]